MSLALCGLLASVAVCAGCQTAPRACERMEVSGDLACRMGHALCVDECPCSHMVLPEMPPEGLPEDVAVALALCHNAAFQETLSDLGIAQADLVQAGLLPNPEAVYFFGVSEKPFKYAFDLPIEAIWLRPIRLRIAERDVERTKERLVQAALDLIRDTRQAYVDLWLARARRDVAAEGGRVRGRIARLAAARLEAGDATPQEAATARVDALQAEQEALRAEFDVRLAEERLRHILGFPRDVCPVFPTSTLELPTSPIVPCELEDEALCLRPDAMASAWSVAAGHERRELAKSVWFRLLGIGDATSGESGHVFGPALRFTVPLFNRNEGGIAQAEAQLRKSEWNCLTVRNQIVLDVRQAVWRYEQARTELDGLESKVLPEVEAAIRRAETAYSEGNAPLLIVLEATRQLLDSRQRQAQLRADLRRAWADLERSVGRRVSDRYASVPSIEPGKLVPQPEPGPAAPAEGPTLPGEPESTP